MQTLLPHAQALWDSKDRWVQNMMHMHGGQLGLQLLAKGTAVPSRERQQTKAAILAYIQDMQPANWTEADLPASRTLRHPQAQKGTATFGSVSNDRAISRVSFYVLLNLRATAASVPSVRSAGAVLCEGA